MKMKGKRNIVSTDTITTCIITVFPSCGRHAQVVGEALEVEEGSAPLEITITTDEDEKTITIQDTASAIRRRLADVRNWVFLA